MWYILFFFFFTKFTRTAYFVDAALKHPIKFQILVWLNTLQYFTKVVIQVIRNNRKQQPNWRQLCISTWSYIYFASQWHNSTYSFLQFVPAQCIFGNKTHSHYILKYQQTVGGWHSSIAKANTWKTGPVLDMHGSFNSELITAPSPLVTAPSPHSPALASTALKMYILFE